MTIVLSHPVGRNCFRWAGCLFVVVLAYCGACAIRATLEDVLAAPVRGGSTPGTGRRRDAPKPTPDAIRRSMDDLKE